MNCALIGPSGAGKGSHAASLVREFGLKHLSAGDLLRDHLDRNTDLGAMARKFMEAGELVPDELVDSMMEHSVEDTPEGQGLLFDGFPRTEHQAQFLDALGGRLGRRLEVVILLDVPESVLLERLTGRWVCRECRTPYHAKFHAPVQAGRCDLCGGELQRRHDDEEEALIRGRLRVFQRSVADVLRYYRGSGRLRVVDAGQSLEAVRAAVLGLARPGAHAEVSLEDRAAAGRLTRWEAVRVAPATEVQLGGMDLVLLGAPGSGKGTQAELLAAELSLPHVATGDLFRLHLRRSTELGLLAKRYMDRGELVPDEITEAMVRERLAQPDVAAGFILDGFPRTLAQAEALREILGELGRGVTRVLYIRVGDEDLLGRLSGRWVCRQCQAPYHLQFKPPRVAGVCDLCQGELYQRDDDNSNTVRARLRTFHAQTEPLIGFYRGSGVLVEVDGESDVDGVRRHIRSALRPPREVMAGSGGRDV